MDTTSVMGSLGVVLALAGSAVGSLLGTGAAGSATLGAWKKCLLEGRAAPMVMVAYVGAPLSQTIYGMILMNALRAAPESVDGMTRFFIGCGGGLVIGGSAWVQGRVGALAADSFGSTGKGFAGNMMVLGVIETVALFMLVFALRAIA